MCITLHDARQVNQRIAIDMEPSNSFGLTMPVAVMMTNHLQSTSLCSISQWKPSSTMTYTLKDMDRVPGCAQVVTGLARAAALSDNSTYTVSESDTSALQALARLRACGMVRCCPPAAQGEQSWVLTPFGQRSLRACQEISDPSPVFRSVAPLCIADATAWQLVDLLESRGWEWKRLPRSKGAKQALVPYRLGAVKEWYSPSNSLSNRVWYLRCLLTLENLEEKGYASEITHTAKNQFYHKVFQGKRPDAAPALHDRGRALELDVDVARPVEAIDSAMADQDNDQQTTEGCESDQSDDLGLGRIIDEEYVDAPNSQADADTLPPTDPPLPPPASPAPSTPPLPPMSPQDDHFAVSEALALLHSGSRILRVSYLFWAHLLFHVI